MKLWFKLAFREIRNNSRFSFFFILNLTLGLVGFIALDSFKISIDNHISQGSRAMLAADMEISANRQLEEKELRELEKELGTILGKTRQVRFMSMIVGKEKTRLAQVVGIEKGYPFYGEIQLDNNREGTPERLEQLLKNDEVWVQPELLMVLNTKKGDPLTIGKLNATISAQLLDSPGTSFFSANIAYRVLMGMKQAEKTELIQFGSRRRHSYLYKLPDNAPLDEISKRLRKRIVAIYGENPPVFANTHQDTSQQTGRLVKYLNDYLGLVSLVALFLAGIGTAYLFRSYLMKGIREIAILISLGATRRSTFFLILLQLTMLGLVASILSSGLSIALLPLLADVLREFLPKGFVPLLSWQSILLAMVMGVLGSSLFCLPVLLRIRHVKAQLLFQENRFPTAITGGISWLTLSSYCLIFTVSLLLSVWQAHSWIIGSVFVLGVLLSLIVIGLIGWSLLWLGGRCFSASDLILKLTFRNLHRNRIPLLSSFLAIGVGALLINLIPQVHNGLREEFERPDSKKLPNLFLFDIQPEQVKPLEVFLKKEGTPLKNISPMIRARLTHINDEAIANRKIEKGKSREEEERGRARRRGYNLSYRSKLSPTETIIEGKPFTGTYDFDSGKLPEISMEVEFARRMEAKVGDRLLFDIQGIPVEGKIINLRRVDWSAFKPNFYVLFQPGVLDEAPGTFLGTLSNLTEDKKVLLQNRIIEQFNNVSIIDISKVVEKILGITGQISWALQVMAFLAVFAGMIVVYSLSRYNAQNRQPEINLLKILGAGFTDIRLMILLEFGLIGLMAAVTGSLLSLIFAGVLSTLLFESLWTITWSVTIESIAGISFLSMATAYMGMRKTLRQKPVSLLQEL